MRRYITMILVAGLAAVVLGSCESAGFGGGGNADLVFDGWGAQVGTGAPNTAAVVAGYGASDPHNSTGNYAARLADQYTYGGIHRLVPAESE